MSNLGAHAITQSSDRLKPLFWFFRLVLNYQEVLGHSNFKLM